MEVIFLRIVKMSLAGSVVILAVLLLRLALRSAPRKYSYLLWAAAAFRLLVPVSLPSPLSLFRLLGRDGGGSSTLLSLPLGPELSASGATWEEAGTVSSLPTQAIPIPSPAAEAAFPWLRLLAWVWLAVLAALLLWGLLSVLRLGRHLGTAVRLEGNVYRAEGLVSPFLLGRRIYVPWGLEGKDLDYALAHEGCHLRRGDPWLRLLGWLVLCLHWFNPLCWLGYLLMGRDMELSCDEAVLARLGDVRREYCESLLRIAERGRPLLPAPLGFGELGVRQRIVNLLRWKRRKGWVSVAALLLCLLFFAACATDPAGQAGQSEALTLNADGTVNAFRWGMTPEEAAAADSRLSFYEYDNNHTKVFAKLTGVSFLGYPAEVTLVFPKLSVEGGWLHYVEYGFPVLEDIQITVPGEIDLTEELTAILGQREKHALDRHSGDGVDYVNGMPRPRYDPRELPEAEWYWHSEELLTDLLSAEQLRLENPNLKDRTDDEILVLSCGFFGWEAYVETQETEEGSVTRIDCAGNGYSLQRFASELSREAGA